jgi:hypothetical protein
MGVTQPPDPAAVVDLLRRWLSSRVAPEPMRWLEGEIARQRAGVDERRLGIALGLVGRHLGRLDLELSSDAGTEGRKLRAGWQPETWATDEAARVAILLATYRGDDEAFAARVDRLCGVAEVTEHVAYLKGFAVFPAPKELYARAREGMRSSIGPIFEAIATRNPYPFDHFDEAAWNQMVVKCVFTGASIETIVGLRERRNSELIAMLRDFAAERRAAHRPLPQSVHHYIGEKS